MLCTRCTEKEQRSGSRGTQVGDAHSLTLKLFKSIETVSDKRHYGNHDGGLVQVTCHLGKLLDGSGCSLIQVLSTVNHS